MKNLKFNFCCKGFTLIEIMLVIAIIGLLAAIALSNYISFRDKAYCIAAENDAVQIINALADHFSIPTNNVAIVGNIPSTGGIVGGVSFKPLSRSNTATISAVSLVHTVIVLDGSQRCPLSYRIPNAASGWSIAAGGGSYTKIFQ